MPIDFITDWIEDVRRFDWMVLTQIILSPIVYFAFFPVVFIKYAIFGNIINRKAQARTDRIIQENIAKMQALYQNGYFEGETK
jgi:hypothetical protein